MGVRGAALQQLLQCTISVPALNVKWGKCGVRPDQPLASGGPGPAESGPDAASNDSRRRDAPRRGRARCRTGAGGAGTCVRRGRSRHGRCGRCVGQRAAGGEHPGRAAAGRDRTGRQGDPALRRCAAHRSRRADLLHDPRQQPRGHAGRGHRGDQAPALRRRVRARIRGRSRLPRRAVRRVPDSRAARSRAARRRRTGARGRRSRQRKIARKRSSEVAPGANDCPQVQRRCV